MQPPESVIYIALGNATKLSQRQFDKLTLSLEFVGKPFLWVIRPDFIINEVGKKKPDGFQQRVANLGKMVSWVPQEKVLAHPSISCFVYSLQLELNSREYHCGGSHALLALLWRSILRQDLCV